MPANNSLDKAAKVRHLALLKEYADDTFATKDDLRNATGTDAEPVSSATAMWTNFNY